MKLSKKKSQELYDVVHEEIMKMRIEIATYLGSRADSNIGATIDNSLSTLCYSAPQKAIDLFEKNEMTSATG